MCIFRKLSASFKYLEHGVDEQGWRALERKFNDWILPIRLLDPSLQRIGVGRSRRQQCTWARLISPFMHSNWKFNWACIAHNFYPQFLDTSPVSVLVKTEQNCCPSFIAIFSQISPHREVQTKILKLLQNFTKLLELPGTVS